MTTSTAIQWPKRATVKRTDLAVNRHYLSACGDWELVEVRWHDPGAYGHYWLCVKRFGAMRVSRHKTRKSAEAACEEFAEGEDDRITDSILAQVNAILRFTEKGPKVFINRDPRGYALKIDDEDMRRLGLQIHSDWGGYGIIAPDLSENR